MHCSIARLSIFIALLVSAPATFANPALFSSHTLRQLSVGSDASPKSNDQQPPIWKRSENIDCETGLQFNEQQWRQCMHYLSKVRISMVGRMSDELRMNACVSWLCTNPDPSFK